MDNFEIEEIHLKVLVIINLHEGGQVKSGHLKPIFVQKAEELVANDYLDSEMLPGRFGDVTIYSMNDVGLEIVQSLGHAILDDSIEMTQKRIKE